MSSQAAVWIDSSSTVTPSATMTIPVFAGAVNATGQAIASQVLGSDLKTYFEGGTVGEFITTTAIATPGALVATTFIGFASTVSGGVVMGYGTTNDVTLKNRAGTNVLGVTANTLDVTFAGAVAFVTSCSSTTALATPSAYAATTSTQFASTVSGAVLMGFGTTNDVSLMNRAGTVVLGVGPNTTAVNLVGTVSVGSTLTLAGPVASTVAQASSVGTTPGTAGTDFSWVPGQGGNTTIATTGVGGKGAGWTLTTGAGGTAAVAVTAGTGGAGGDLTFTTGAGAASAVTGAGTGTGGKGGAIALVSGIGGATSTSTGVNLGGASGAITFTTAAGGASTNGSSNTGGASGVVTIATGNGGAGATAQGNSGAITLQTGSSTGTVGSVILSPGTLALVTCSWTSATVGLVTIGGTYGAGVASMRYNGLTTATTNNLTGTLTNSPVTGNPTFWMPVSIAGVIKYIPCW